MDTFSYLHLAETYEAAANSELGTVNGSELLLPELDWVKERSGAFILLASFAVSLGSLSWSNSALALKKGHKNSQVISLQQKLRAAGYFQENVTGYFGPVTEAAVIKFQQANGLIADGIAGHETLSALESGLLTPTPLTSSVTTPSSVVTAEQSKLSHTSNLVLQKGDNNSQVMSLQQKLQAAGYFKEPITGYFDTATQAAVIRFQKANRLTVDGLVGNQTLSVLTSIYEQPIPPVSKNTPSQNVIVNPKQIENQDKKTDIQDNFPSYQTQAPTRMKLIKTISGKISPKSVVYSGNGLFFAQNMMYNHTITVYNRDYELVKVIPDKINLSKYGYAKFKGNYQGAPVEASFSHNGKYAWVSNYNMYGSGFNKPGTDKCNPSQKTDRSFLYRINTETLEIDRVIQVGSVPKFVATSPDERLVLVSNWCSWDLSVVDTEKNQEIKRIKLGPYPRGIVVNATSEKAYVAVMGSYGIAEVNLRNFSVRWLRNIGRSPRHLNIDPAGKYLYSSLNGEGKIAKISLPTGKLIDKISTGNAPRSMVLSQDGQKLYVVNYGDNTVSKVSTSNMKVIQKVNVNANPIGITYDPESREVWVACYSGNIMVFQD